MFVGLNFLSPANQQSAVTWNPLDKSANVTLSNGNLTATGIITASGTVRATVGATTGNFYHEIVVRSPQAATASFCAGVTNGSMALTANVGSNNNSIGFITSGSILRNNTNIGVGLLGALVDGDVIGIAVNIALGRIFFRKNGGAWISSGNPTAGTGGHTFTASGTIYPACSCSGSVQNFTARFTSASWGTAAPSGYGEWV